MTFVTKSFLIENSLFFVFSFFRPFDLITGMRKGVYPYIELL
jgi:hypothetical protein